MSTKSHTDTMATCVALWSDAGQMSALPAEWLRRSVAFFERYRLSPLLYTAFGGSFLHDDCYVWAEAGRDLVLWEEPIPAVEKVLIQAFANGLITSLSADVPRADSRGRSEWRATLCASSDPGEAFVGLEAAIEPEPRNLLSTALALVKDIFDVRYGFAFTMSLGEEPICYASGIERMTFTQAVELLRHPKLEPQPKSADELWHDELLGAQRHLTGLFRAAFPVNVLSRAHVEGAGLETAGIGKLLQLDDGLWLWELAPEELADGELWLEFRRVLVRQQDR